MIINKVSPSAYNNYRLKSLVIARLYQANKNWSKVQVNESNNCLVFNLLCKVLFVILNILGAKILMKSVIGEKDLGIVPFVAAPLKGRFFVFLQ